MKYVKFCPVCGHITWHNQKPEESDYEGCDMGDEAIAKSFARNLDDYEQYRDNTCSLCSAKLHESKILISDYVKTVDYDFSAPIWERGIHDHEAQVALNRHLLKKEIYPLGLMDKKAPFLTYTTSSYDFNMKYTFGYNCKVYTIRSEALRNEPQYEPVCPKCGGIKIADISDQKPLLGIFKKKKASQFKCLDCKHKW